MKAREDRRKTLIRARMRCGCAWRDVAILNLSPHGAGLQCAEPPPCGAYVEIRRGAHILIARVAWSDGRRFGVRSQHPLAVEAIIAEPSTTDPRPAAADAPRAERRTARRTNVRHERSRSVARAAEFAALALFGAAAGAGLYSALSEALAQPLQAVTGAMDARR